MILSRFPWRQNLFPKKPFLFSFDISLFPTFHHSLSSFSARPPYHLLDTPPSSLIGAPFIPPSISPSDMGRVGYPDKARLYKQTALQQEELPALGEEFPLRAHTNAYIFAHTPAVTRMPAYAIQTQTSTESLTTFFLFSLCFFFFYFWSNLSAAVEIVC